MTVYRWRPESYVLEQPRELLVDTRWAVSQLRAALHTACFSDEERLQGQGQGLGQGQGQGGLQAEDVGIAQYGDGYGAPPPVLDMPDLPWDKDKVAEMAAAVKAAVDGMVAKVASSSTVYPASASASTAASPSLAPMAAGAGPGAATTTTAAATAAAATTASSVSTSATPSTLCGPHYFARDEKVFFCRDKRAILRELLPEEQQRLEKDAQLTRAQHASARLAAAAAAGGTAKGAAPAAEQQLKIRVRKREAATTEAAAAASDAATAGAGVPSVLVAPTTAPVPTAEAEPETAVAMATDDRAPEEPPSQAQQTLPAAADTAASAGPAGHAVGLPTAAQAAQLQQLLLFMSASGMAAGAAPTTAAGVAAGATTASPEEEEATPMELDDDGDDGKQPQSDRSS